MYKFIMSIGDWSNDGHGQHVTYTIKSNKPVEEVREAHFNIKDKTGIDIENICSEYQDCRLDDTYYNKLLDLGFKFPPTEFDSHDITPFTMARIWIFLLNKTDPSLNLNMENTKDIPTLHFYGFDEKNRHIDFVGYGCFSDD